MKKILIALIFVILTSCGKENEGEKTSQRQSEIQSQSQADFETTGQTKIIFENKGQFRGDYLGKIAADGKDYGLTDTAWLYYHGEEIHDSEFKGIFEITEVIDDYRYKLDLRDYKITTKEGVYDQIYYHVDFALGLDSESDYILYRPGCPIKDLEKDDKLLEIAKKGSTDGEKTRGFIIYNKTDGEIFSQNQ